jgi:hypothetical protein
VRETYADSSLNVRANQFASGPVRELLRISDRAYAEHAEMTVPYAERGARLLPGDRFEHYAARMEHYKAELERQLPYVVEHWDELVTIDIESRQAQARHRKPHETPKPISRDTYLRADQVVKSFGIEWDVSPVPYNDFRTQMPEYVKEKNRAKMQYVEQLVRREVIGRMLEPVKHAIEKLEIPLGEKGSVFRDSMMSNLQDVLQQAAQLNVADDPDIAKAIQEMTVVVHGYMGSAESLRTQAEHRKNAAAKLNELSNMFNGLL